MVSFFASENQLKVTDLEELRKKIDEIKRKKQ
jgi:hypothetical protein